MTAGKAPAASNASPLGRPLPENGEERVKMAKKVVCKIKGPHCLGTFRMGYDGTVDGCDPCTGIQRDKNGYAWDAGETEQTYRPNGAPDDGSQDFTVTRRQAFGQ